MSTQIFINQPSEFTTVVRRITSAQIKTMGTRAITLLPAPGANKYYVVNRVTLEYTFKTIPYIFPVSPVFYLDGCFDSYIDKTLLTSSTNTVATISGNLRNTYNVGTASGSTFVKTNKDVLNSSLIMSTNSSDDPTLGDGTMNVIIEYKIVTFT